MKLFVLMHFYESVHINLSFLKSKPCEFTGPLTPPDLRRPAEQAVHVRRVKFS